MDDSGTSAREAVLNRTQPAVRAKLLRLEERKAACDRKVGETDPALIPRGVEGAVQEWLTGQGYEPLTKEDRAYYRTNFEVPVAAEIQRRTEDQARLLDLSLREEHDLLHGRAVGGLTKHRAELHGPEPLNEPSHRYGSWRRHGHDDDAGHVHDRPLPSGVATSGTAPLGYTCRVLTEKEAEDYRIRAKLLRLLTEGLEAYANDQSLEDTAGGRA